MSGLRQRADALRFFLSGPSPPAAAASVEGGAAAAVQNGSGPAASAPADERDVTDEVLAALRQVAPHLEVSLGIQCVSVACSSPRDWIDWFHNRAETVVACETDALPSQLSEGDARHVAGVNIPFVICPPERRGSGDLGFRDR